MRLLLLEHRSAFAERLAAALSDSGQWTCECDSLGAFERRVATNVAFSFDAIVLDLRQDGQHGLRLCRRVADRTPDIPIVAITALDDPDDAIRLIQAGAEDVCLRTEFDTESLLTRLKCAVERFRIRALMAHHVFSTCCASPPSRSHALDTPQGTDLPQGTVASGESFDASVDQAFPPLQMACVVAPGFESSSASEPIWTQSLRSPVEISLLENLTELTEHVTLNHVDAVVLYLPEVNSELLDTLASVRAECEDAVIVVNAPAPAGELSLQCIRHGADDLVASDHASHDLIARHVRQGIGRRQRLERCDDPPTVLTGAPRLEIRESSFPRRDPRYYVTRSAIAIPIQDNSKPDRTIRAEGFTVDFSNSGIGFEVGDLKDLPSERLLAGVEGDDGLLYFATVEVRNWSQERGRLHVGAQFVSGERDLLRPDNLTPFYHAGTHRFAPGLPAETLHEWVELGIMRPMLMDRIYVCPKCSSMPTFRSGCRSCGSIHVASPRLIHHYPCSYLGRINEYDSSGIVTCPKCGVQSAMQDDEFEFVNGPCHCLECNWSDTTPEVVGQCTQCAWHFPLKDASEEELIGYHVNRLNPQAILGMCSAE